MYLMKCRCVLNQVQRHAQNYHYFCPHKICDQRKTSLFSPSLVSGYSSRLLYSTEKSSKKSDDKPTFLTGLVAPPTEDAAASKKTIEEVEREMEEAEKEKQEKDFKQKRAMKISFYVVGGSTLGFGLFFLWKNGQPRLDEDGNEVTDEFSDLPTWKAIFKRSWNEAKFMKKQVVEPSREKLLPDPLSEPYYQPPYTLVLELKHILVHPDWTYGTGWRFKKRPGVDFFLEQVGPPLFEVVIYTSENGPVAYPITDGLDSRGLIWYRLFRDVTRYVDGVHCKDLNCLNRDLSKVIMLDWDKKALELSPENALIIPKWDGDDADKYLIDLAMMLRTVATSGVGDVRDVLSHYRQFDDPVEVFREKQRVLQEQQEEALRMSQEAQEKKLTSSWSGSFFKRRF